jgi:isopenicillin N synthase-like dioxygenase
MFQPSNNIQETVDLGSATDDLVDNIWPSENTLPGFRHFMESFYEKAFKTELELFSALSIALGVSEEHMRSLHSRAENEFRLLHYPSIPASDLADGSATRIAEHTDFGTITMLFQDSVGGLQVEDQADLGTFHSIESSRPTDIILNIGDSLQRLTNDTFKAACHVPSGDQSRRHCRDSRTLFGRLLREAKSLGFFAAFEGVHYIGYAVSL